jgi:hypothetical protein
MDWRSYIPYALVGGAIFGAVLAAILIPILQRREIRRRRQAIRLTIEQMESSPSTKGPCKPYVPHKKWNSMRRPRKGYYEST